MVLEGSQYGFDVRPCEADENAAEQLTLALGVHYSGRSVSRGNKRRHCVHERYASFIANFVHRLKRYNVVQMLGPEPRFTRRQAKIGWSAL